MFVCNFSKVRKLWFTSGLILGGPIRSTVSQKGVNRVKTVLWNSSSKTHSEVVRNTCDHVVYCKP